MSTTPIIVMANGEEILVTAYDDNSVTFIVPSGAVSGPITIQIGTCTYNVNLDINVIKPGNGEGVHVVTYTDYRWKKISSTQYQVDVLYDDYKYIANSDTYRHDIVYYTYRYDVSHNSIMVYKIKNLVRGSREVNNISVYKRKNIIRKYIENILIHVHKYNATKQIKRIP